MIAYKLMRKKKDGLLYSLFINNNSPIKLGVWLKANCYPTKKFSVRKGWHCCFKPLAPHLKMRLKNGEKRTWMKVEVDGYEIFPRPKSQGSSWILAQKIKVIGEKNG
jgi:hypothetical protein